MICGPTKQRYTVLQSPQLWIYAPGTHPTSRRTVPIRQFAKRSQMSLLPLILADEVFDRPRSLCDQHFGLGISLGDLVREKYNHLPLRSGYLRPWRHMHSADSGLSKVSNDKDGFKVSLDVQQFKPDELNVKVVDDYLVVEGNHEERSDEHGFVSRQFTRRYKIPNDVDKKNLASTLSSDGVLQLEAPKLSLKGSGERSIPIIHTNQPALKHDEEKKKKKDEKA